MAEHLTVDQDVVGSTPISHPHNFLCKEFHSKKIFPTPIRYFLQSLLMFMVERLYVKKIRFEFIYLSVWNLFHR